MAKCAGGRAAAALLGVAVLLATWSGPSWAQKYADFVNQKFKFATQLPAHWDSEVKDNSLIFSGPKGTEEFFATINFQIITRKPYDSLGIQVTSLERQWATAPQYRRLSKNTAWVGGQPAMRLVATYQRPGSTEMFQQDQVIIEREPYFYYIAYTAPAALFPKYQAAMDHAVKSFKFLP